MTEHTAERVQVWEIGDLEGDENVCTCWQIVSDHDGGKMRDHTPLNRAKRRWVARQQRVVGDIE